LADLREAFPKPEGRQRDWIGENPKLKSAAQLWIGFHCEDRGSPQLRYRQQAMNENDREKKGAGKAISVAQSPKTISK